MYNYGNLYVFLLVPGTLSWFEHEKERGHLDFATVYDTILLVSFVDDPHNPFGRIDFIPPMVVFDE